MIEGRAARSVLGAMHLHPHLAFELMRSTDRQRLAEGAASRASAKAAMAPRGGPRPKRRWRRAPTLSHEVGQAAGGPSLMQ